MTEDVITAHGCRDQKLTLGHLAREALRSLELAFDSLQPMCVPLRYWILNFGSESCSILGPTQILLNCGSVLTLAPGSNFTVRVQGLVMIELFGEHRY